MKLFKRLVVLLMVLTLGLTGCSSNDSSDKSALDKIKDADVIKIGVKSDVPNFGLQNTSTNEYEGLEIDLAKEIAKEILGDESKVEFTAVTAKTRGPLLEKGEIDMVIANFTITDERKETYNFSTPYYEDPVQLLIREEDSDKYTTLKDFDGKTIGVAKSSTTKEILSEEASKLGITLNFNEYDSYPDINTALDGKRIDCFSVDGSILRGYLTGHKLLDDKYAPQEYGVATAKENTDLADEVDKIIGELKDSGKLDEMVTKWGLD